VSALEPILVNVKFRSLEFGDVVLIECPICLALVLEDKLSMHVGSHDDE
jgi:hypothetical protein